MADKEFEKTVAVPGGTLKTYADGSQVLDVLGATMVNDGDRATVTVDDIRKISIENVTDLVSYKIDTGETAVSHHMQFRNGGEARLSYLKSGKLLEFHLQRLRVSLNEDGEVEIMLPENAGEFEP